MAKLRHKIIADFLLLLHLFWIILLAGGTVFIFYNRWYIPYHLTLITGTAFLNLLFGGCPISWWEEKYRKAWDPDALYHRDSFFATYAGKLLGTNITPRQANRFLVFAKIISYSLSILLLTHLL